MGEGWGEGETPILAFPLRGKGLILSPLRGRVRVGVIHCNEYVIVYDHKQC